MIDYQNVDATIIEARPDWVTCTARRGEAALKLMRFAQDQIAIAQDNGDKITTYKMQGYVGFQTEDWRWGSGEHGVLVAASKEEAAIHAEKLAAFADHWTRVDYCVTVQTEPGAINPDVDYWEMYDVRPDFKGQIADLGRRQYKRGAPTVELGSRSSPRYLRIYDKHRESQGDYPAGSWRWEIEMKAQEAEHEHSLWQVGNVSYARICNLIASHLEPYGLQVPWPSDGTVPRQPAIRHRREADRLLNWFERQVAPSVRYVAEVRGRDAVLRALNL